MNLKHKFQKGVSLVEGMTACAVLGLAVTVFMTLQSTQERDFSNLSTSRLSFESNTCESCMAALLLFLHLPYMWDYGETEYQSEIFEVTIPLSENLSAIDLLEVS